MNKDPVLMTPISTVHSSPVTPAEAPLPASIFPSYPPIPTFPSPSVTYGRHAAIHPHKTAIVTPQNGLSSRHHDNSRNSSSRSNPAASQPSQGGVMSPAAVFITRTVRIDNLDASFINKAKSLDAFSRIGQVETCQVEYQPVIKGQGRAAKSVTAQVTFASPQLAVRAVIALNGRLYGERMLSAKLTSPPPDESARHRPSTTMTSSSSSSLNLPPLAESSRANSRHKDRRPVAFDEEQQDRKPKTRGPLVVDGARGTTRRRRDVSNGKHAESVAESSDSDASDEEREARRRGSSGSREDVDFERKRRD
jgi:hypothetical protein